MTTRRFTRRATRNPIRRTFIDGTGSSTTLGTNMVDITPVSELGATVDSQFGDLLVTGISWIDTLDEAGVHQILVWVGRSSTEPDQADTGVRTRQMVANRDGLPFVVRYRGLRVNPGQLMKLISHPIAESLATVIHQQLVSVKWSFRELRQG